MYMRGVFFVLFLVLCCTFVAEAVGFSGELIGSVGTDGISHGLSFDVEYELAWLGLQLGWDGETTTENSSHHMQWQVLIAPREGFKLVLNHNRDHHTTSDLFRLINKNNFDSNSSFYGIFSDQLGIGFLRKVPLKNLDLVDAWFCESSLELGSLSLQSTQLKYAGFKESGAAQVIQATGNLGPWQGLGGVGWQVDSRGAESRGSVLEIKGIGEGWKASIVWQKTDQNFISPLAKTNKYTPNRRGWHLELGSSYHNLEVGLNLRRHSNIKFTNTYNQFAWKLKAKDTNTSLEWRIEPTPGFILRYAAGDTLLQIDAWNSVLRYDFRSKGVDYSCRFDGRRWIARLELKFKLGPEWRLIGKYDLLSKGTYCSLLMRHNGPNSHLQLELGQYDRGNIASGFNNSPTFRISWGWKF